MCGRLRFRETDMGNRCNYWRRILGLAATESWQWVLGHPTGVLLTLAATAAGTMALWQFGSSDGLYDQIITLSGGAIVIFIAFILVCGWRLAAIPPRLHQLQADKVRELEIEVEQHVARSVPTLIFEFDPDHRKHIDRIRVEQSQAGGSGLTLTRDPTQFGLASYRYMGPERFVGRVALRNTSSNKTVHGVTVRIVECERMNSGKPLSINLLLTSASMGARQVAIHAQEGELFDLFSVLTNKASTFALAPGKDPSGKNLGVGEYRVQLVAAGNDVAPVRASYLIRIGNDQAAIEVSN